MKLEKLLNTYPLGLINFIVKKKNNKERFLVKSNEKFIKKS